MLRVWERGEVPDEELERLCGSPDHQGIVAEVEPYRYVDAASLLGPEDALVVALPLRGRLESLNVAATAAALLYEIVRQRTES